MADVATQEMSPTIATAVLNAAMQGHMISAIPESDGDKIAEAQRILTLADQAKVVADQIGHSNVPNWPIVENVLRAGGIDPSSPIAPAATPAPGVGAGTAQFEQPTPDAVAPGAIDPGPAAMGQVPPPHPDLIAAVGPGTAYNPVPGSAAAQVPPNENGAHIVPAPAPPATDQPPTEPAAGQTWADANGTGWLIVTYEGGPQLEIQSIATGEKTIAPVGFLKRPVIIESQLPQQEVSQSEPQPSSQPASSPVPPSSPPPTSTPSATPTSAPMPSGDGGAVQSAPSQPQPSAPPSSTSSEQSDPGERSEPQQFSAPIDDDEGDEKYGELLEQVTADYQPVAMPTPMDLERPPAAMPDDLTQIDDVNARALHSQFNALASRARYLYGLEAAKARACDRLYKYNLKGAMREARAQLGKDASVTEVQQLAEDNTLVEPWMRRRDRHSDRAEAYKTFLTFYTEDVSVLSRDWTMRDKEEKGS